MADVNIIFMHPGDGRKLTVTLDNSITAEEAVAELIAAEFIPPSDQGYTLAIKGGAEIPTGKSFQDAGVENNNTIRIVPATDAGHK